MLLNGLRSLKRSRTKSFSRILAARKLEREQKFDEAGAERLQHRLQQVIIIALRRI